MQLDDKLLKEIESGNSLVFKGDLDENVVLCTEDKTYDVKEAETSNSLLLVPNLLYAESTGDQIASRAELDVELNKIQAVKIDGYYRLLEFDYEFRVLSYMLDLIEENSWPLNRISKEITFESLKDLVPESVLEALFRFYTVETSKEDDIQYYQYKQDKVCRFLARVLLKSAGKFNFTEFLQAWRDSVPEGMITDESLLSGIAIVDKNTTPQVVWGFSENDLPDDINERFKTLFRTKAKWTVDEISPYIESYATEKLNVNALLTKYARASTQDGVRVFSAKHMK
ncbi:Sister chromatid cohesion protein DCC1 [Papilio machaon]|uniref:Sister chromatid cohesion protein DCC1 n=1 Tax=Papilio machaon TaxID=76193 RepID=A0A0N1PJ80_PAPMA|nr:Sister chromatid cohesion protein DCC1 [Papilio machaon]